MEDWHGWGQRRPRKISLHIGYLPGRKSVALYSEREPEGGGALLDVHAYFRSEAHAREVMRILDLLIDTA